jgi:hypothetical protein
MLLVHIIADQLGRFDTIQTSRNMEVGIISAIRQEQEDATGPPDVALMYDHGFNTTDLNVLVGPYDKLWTMCSSKFSLRGNTQPARKGNAANLIKRCIPCQDFEHSALLPRQRELNTSNDLMT